MESQEIEKQIGELNEWIKSNPDSRELKRALAVKFALQGLNYQWIADALGVSKSFISKWKSMFCTVDYVGLKLSYQGSKSYLTTEEKKETLSWLKEQEYWDLSELECHLIEQYDVVFQSKTSYYNLLSEAKITRQKAQTSNSRKNPEEVEKKNLKINSILEDLEPQIKAVKVAVYAIDEVHLLEGDPIASSLGRQRKKVEYFPKK